MKIKLTDADGYTRRGEDNETLWGEGIGHTAMGKGRELCTSDVIHYYDSVEEAVMYNPVHACISNPVAWECGGRMAAHDGAKGGCKTLTTIRRVPLPELTIEQRIKVAIYCALEVCTSPDFVRWANAWLIGADRSGEAAQAAVSAAWAVCEAGAAECDAGVAACEAAYGGVNVRAIIRRVIDETDDI